MLSVNAGKSIRHRFQLSLISESDYKYIIMTRVDFYILPEHGTGAQQAFACRLLQKTLKLGHKAYIHCRHEQQARELDTLLWQFQPNSFLPHKLINEAGAACPVEIGFGDDPGAHDDLLINLSGAIPSFFSRFQRVSEIVTQDNEILQAGRNNYRFYQDRNYPLHRHDMRR